MSIRSGATIQQVQAARVTADYDTRYGATSGPWTTPMLVEAVYTSCLKKPVAKSPEKYMDLGGLDLNLLVALDALFAEKSVSRAGERLHLSQSATSGALAPPARCFAIRCLCRWAAAW